jgi:hypothetical protein
VNRTAVVYGTARAAIKIATKRLSLIKSCPERDDLAAVRAQLQAMLSDATNQASGSCSVKKHM